MIEFFSCFKLESVWNHQELHPKWEEMSIFSTISSRPTKHLMHHQPSYQPSNRNFCSVFHWPLSSMFELLKIPPDKFFGLLRTRIPLPCFQTSSVEDRTKQETEPTCNDIHGSACGKHFHRKPVERYEANFRLSVWLGCTVISIMLCSLWTSNKSKSINSTMPPFKDRKALLSFEVNSYSSFTYRT